MSTLASTLRLVGLLAIVVGNFVLIRELARYEPDGVSSNVGALEGFLLGALGGKALAVARHASERRHVRALGHVLLAGWNTVGLMLFAIGARIASRGDVTPTPFPTDDLQAQVIWVVAWAVALAAMAGVFLSLASWFQGLVILAHVVASWAADRIPQLRRRGIGDRIRNGTPPPI